MKKEVKSKPLTGPCLINVQTFRPSGFLSLRRAILGKASSITKSFICMCAKSQDYVIMNRFTTSANGIVLVKVTITKHYK